MQDNIEGKSLRPMLVLALEEMIYHQRRASCSRVHQSAARYYRRLARTLEAIFKLQLQLELELNENHPAQKGGGLAGWFMTDCPSRVCPDSLAQVGYSDKRKR